MIAKRVYGRYEWFCFFVLPGFIQDPFMEWNARLELAAYRICMVLHSCASRIHLGALYDQSHASSEKGKKWKEHVEDNPDTPIHLYKVQNGESFANSQLLDADEYSECRALPPQNLEGIWPNNMISLLKVINITLFLPNQHNCGKHLLVTSKFY